MSLTLVKELKGEALRDEIRAPVEAKLLEAIAGPGAAEETVESFRRLLRDGELDDRDVAIDVPVKDGAGGGAGAGAGGAPGLEVNVAGREAAGVALRDDFREIVLRLQDGLGGGGSGGGGGRGKVQLARRTLKVRARRAAQREFSGSRAHPPPPPCASPPTGPRRAHRPL